jgi:hypothetical protein
MMAQTTAPLWLQARGLFILAYPVELSDQERVDEATLPSIVARHGQCKGRTMANGIDTVSEFVRDFSATDYRSQSINR